MNRVRAHQLYINPHDKGKGPRLEILRVVKDKAVVFYTKPNGDPVSFVRSTKYIDKEWELLV